MKIEIENFKIETIKAVTFRDMNGAVTAHLPVGSVVDATGPSDPKCPPLYFNTPLGGIYADEARRIN